MSLSSLASLECVIKSGVTVTTDDLIWADPADAKVTNVPASGLLFLGRAEITTGTDASRTGNAGGTVTCGVLLGREVPVVNVKPSTANPATPFKLAYPNASKEATSANTVNAPIGLCLQVDSVVGASIAYNF